MLQQYDEGFLCLSVCDIEDRNQNDEEFMNHSNLSMEFNH
jgi:hypothetical protein